MTKDQLLKLIENRAERALAEKVLGPHFFGNRELPEGFVDAIVSGDIDKASHLIWSNPPPSHPEGIARLLMGARR